MSAEPTDLARLATGAGSAVPLYFESAAHRLFAWLHRPAVQAAPGLGLVICKPFGYDALCAHRSMRAFAEAAVELGVPALRFDYRGTGDSDDTDPAADQIDLWRQDVVAAVSELRRQTGVQRVCLLGFRLGALLAILAAAGSEAVEAVMVVAPVLSGRRYLRELRTTQLAAAEPGTVIRNDPQAPGAGAMEVSGFSLSAATVAHLSQLDLSAPGEPPASDVLIIDRDDLPGARGWSESLAALGVRTRYVALPGFVEMVMTAPHLAVIPQSMVAAMREWLRSLQGAVSAPSPGGAESHPGRGEPRAPAPVLTLSNESASEAAPSEHPVLLGAQRTLFGIVTKPAADEPRRRAVILLNAGATYHIGSGRVYVSLARRWARRGYVVLRMDLAGLGDSATRPGEPDNEVFPPAALEDVRTALEFLRQHYQVREFAVGGLCSAAYHALRAAVAGLPVNRLLMVNPQNFVWNEAEMRGDLAEVVRDFGGYRESVLSAAAWKRVLRGQVNVRRVVGVYLHRVRIALQSAARDVARQLRIRLPNDVGSQLEEIAARGVRVVFVFARGDPGIELLRIQGGSAVKRLGDRCHVHIVDSADHTFTQSRARAILEQILSDELFVRHDQRVDASGARQVAGDDGNDEVSAGDAK
jgi:alpha-beta hydrolase superfamily lysophospholipase